MSPDHDRPSLGARILAEAGSWAGMICEGMTGHRMGPWSQWQMTGIESHYNRSQCRICRQWYLRPRPLDPLPDEG